MHVRKITNLEYLFRYVRLSDCEKSDSYSQTVKKFKIGIFLKNCRVKSFIVPNISSVLHKIRNVSSYIFGRTGYKPLNLLKETKTS